MPAHSIPKLLKPQTLAKDNQVLVGAVLLSAFPRLSEHLASMEGDIGISLGFSQIAKDRVSIDLKVQGTLPLICQRCLEPYDEPIHSEVKLSPIQEDDEAEDLPEEQEAVILEQGNLNVYSMIEDEILLSLPTIPCHPLLQCPARDKVVIEGEETKNNSNTPGQFAILANLKKNPS